MEPHEVRRYGRNDSWYATGAYRNQSRERPLPRFPPPATGETMSARNTKMRATDVGHIQNGWNAYDANGERIGDVVEVDSAYVLVRKGMFFPKDLYIPLTAVTSVDEAGETFFVNVT